MIAADYKFVVGPTKTNLYHQVFTGMTDFYEAVRIFLTPGVKAK